MPGVVFWYSTNYYWPYLQCHSARGGITITEAKTNRNLLRYPKRENGSVESVPPTCACAIRKIGVACNSILSTEALSSPPAGSVLLMLVSIAQRTRVYNAHMCVHEALRSTFRAYAKSDY